MNHVHVEVERSIKSAVEEIRGGYMGIWSYQMNKQGCFINYGFHY